MKQNTSQPLTPLGNMSSVETSLVEMQSLIAKHGQLEEKVTAAPERLLPSFRIALSSVETKIRDIVEQPEVIALEQSLTSQQQSDIGTISELFEDGLLDEEECAREMHRILSDDVYRPLALISIGKSVGKVSLTDSVEISFVDNHDQAPVVTNRPVADSTERTETTTAVTEPFTPAKPIDGKPVAQDESPTPEVVKEEQEVALTFIKSIDGTSIKIGSRGRIIRLSDATLAHHKDYTEERKKTIEFLIENQGRQVTVKELMKSVGITSSYELSQVRNVIMNLTYKSQPLFERTGNTRAKSDRSHVVP